LSALIRGISHIKSDNIRVIVSNTNDFYNFKFYQSVTNRTQIKSVDKIDQLGIDYFSRFDQYGANLILIKCNIVKLFTLNNYLNVNNLPYVVWIPES